MYKGIIEVKNGTMYSDYNLYLKSTHWGSKKRQYAKEYIHCCVVCGDTKNKLHLHHMTYERVGKEELDDLCYLCYKCHYFVHSGELVVPTRAILDTFKKSYKKEKKSEYLKNKKAKKKALKKEEKALFKKQNRESRKLSKIEKAKSELELAKKQKIRNTSFAKLSEVLGIPFGEKQLGMCCGKFIAFGSGAYQIKCLDKDERIITIITLKTNSRLTYKIIDV